MGILPSQPRSPIPALLNCRAGAAEDAGRSLASDDRFTLCELEPSELPAAIRSSVSSGTRRVLVCGGDGSIATAAASLAGTGVELAILPSGTLNHFARDHGIPTELGDALDVAAGERTTTVDLGEVNGRIFLNTFSVGSYVRFVRRRERLQSWFGYKASSFLAGLGVLSDLRGYSLVLEAAGSVQHYATPLIFIGVGERDLAIPKLGSRREGGAKGLHALIVRSRARARLITLALAAASRGAEHAARTPALDSFLVERCTVDMHRAQATVALDGELVRLTSPLHLRLVPDALTLVVG